MVVSLSSFINLTSTFIIPIHLTSIIPCLLSLPDSLIPSLLHSLLPSYFFFHTLITPCYLGDIPSSQSPIPSLTTYSIVSFLPHPYHTPPSFLHHSPLSVLLPFFLFSLFLHPLIINLPSSCPSTLHERSVVYTCPVSSDSKALHRSSSIMAKFEYE